LHQGRCAAVLFYGHQLAVLPAAGADAPDFADELEAGVKSDGSAAAVANSYVVDLSAQGIREVRCVQIVCCSSNLHRSADRMHGR
jgi:hypothetical protein